jgi:hypothetical protein
VAIAGYVGVASSATYLFRIITIRDFIFLFKRGPFRRQFLPKEENSDLWAAFSVI